MATLLSSSFLPVHKTAKTPARLARAKQAQWENSLAAVTLPPELMSLFGGQRHRLITAKRRGVIDALKKLKKLEGREGQQVVFHQLYASPREEDDGHEPDPFAGYDGILSDVALSGALKNKNITPTASRLVMMKILFQRKNHQHLTAEEIFIKLKSKKKAGISLASIYNTLNILTKHGLLARHHFSSLLSNGKKRGAIFYDTNIMPHHHVIDKSSEKIYDLPLDIISIDAVADLASKKIKKGNLIPRKLWRAQGVRKDIFVMPMIFVVE